MTLEDHVGDIIRKAREMAGASPETVARAAGLSVGELAAWEDSGRVEKRPDFKGLASLLDLQPEKLERIWDGGLPAKPDLDQWREIRQISTAQGGMTVHCYLLWDEVTREAALFDTGWDASLAFAEL